MGTDRTTRNPHEHAQIPPPAAEIFKAYDIRGIVDTTLTASAVEAIGHALGSEARARNQQAIAVGRDGRLSGPELSGALARGFVPPGSTSSTSAAYPRR